MSYPTLPGRAIPYHEDGTIVKYLTATEGVTDTLSSAQMAELNDEDYTNVSGSADQKEDLYVVFFFPEKREITGIFAMFQTNQPTPYRSADDFQGSNDTTNGYDGTWTSLTEGSLNAASDDFDAWRSDIATISFASEYETYRLKKSSVSPNNINGAKIVHLYGKEKAGETDDDIIFLDADNADAEFALPKDFQGIPTGESEECNFKIKNDSSSNTANSITLTVEDSEDIVRISEDGGSTWVTTITIASLAAGASSSNIKIKAESPAAPTPLQPERGWIHVEVGSWT